MKSINFIAFLLFAGWLAACNSGTDSAGLEATTDVTDTAGAKISGEQDTTLQHIQEITLKAIGDNEDDMVFDQDTLEVNASNLVKLTLINEGTEPSMIHNVVFTQPGKQKLVALAGANVGSPGNYVPESKAVISASPLALPGQTVELEFTAPADTGTYGFVCTYPGHWKKMIGILLVK